VLAEWRAALFRVMKFREVLSMSEYGYEQKNPTFHPRYRAEQQNLHNSAAR
jgi:hypothetical protein